MGVPFSIWIRSTMLFVQREEQERYMHAFKLAGSNKKPRAQ